MARRLTPVSTTRCMGLALSCANTYFTVLLEAFCWKMLTGPHQFAGQIQVVLGLSLLLPLGLALGHHGLLVAAAGPHAGLSFPQLPLQPVVLPPAPPHYCSSDAGPGMLACGDRMLGVKSEASASPSSPCSHRPCRLKIGLHVRPGDMMVARRAMYGFSSFWQLTQQPGVSTPCSSWDLGGLPWDIC